ncbi:hypothetical protein AAVH_07594 [Aphelenchoides avenae]|nr:hypothetical protein AAVH_07594 [Aphelenchus avenae]
MQSLRRFVLIAVSVMVAFTCINRHSVFVNHLSGQLPTIGALLAIGCLQPPASLASHASSASLEMFHRYTSVLVGVAVLGHHAAEAELVEVNKRNFKNTPYYGTPVRLKGKDIFITLNKHANHTSITWRFDSKSAWKIQLDKCDDGYPNAAIVIADSCKWQFVWNEMLEFRLIANDGKENSWKFDDPPLRKLQIELGKKKPTMTIYTVTGGGGTSLTDPTKNIPLGTPDFCMLATDNFNVNMTSTEPNCPISMDAKLFYDFYDSTTATATTDVSHPLPVWTGTGSPPSGYVTKAKTHVTTENPSNTTADPALGTGEIIGIAAGALALIALLAGAVIALICICRRRRQEQGDYDFAEDPQVSAQVEKEEGLIEWEDVMAHAPYDVNTQPLIKNWPYGKGDTVELGSITANENTCSRGKPAEAKMYGVELDILRFLDDVKGTEDYGVVEGRFEWKAEGNPDEGSRCWSQLVVIYYSFPPDRVKVFVDRLKYLAKLDKARNDNIKKAVQAAKEAGLEGPPKELNCRTDQLRVPELKYFWVSPDPKKISFLVLEYVCAREPPSYAVIMRFSTATHWDKS